MSSSVLKKSTAEIYKFQQCIDCKSKPRKKYKQNWIIIIITSQQNQKR